MYRILPLLVSLILPCAASAQEETEREFDMEMSMRFRTMQLPDSILDIWFYDSTDAGWVDSEPRPSITGIAPGVEFVVKGDGPNGIFYFDYVISQMPGGYWDDREEPPNHMDGDYLVPADNLGLWTLGADYAHELFFVRTENTDGKFGLSFMIGGGLGVAGLIGSTQCGPEEGAICRWEPQGAMAAHNRFHSGVPADEAKAGIPKVIPMVDINAGLRFNFGNRVVLRVEGGLHDLIYGGATLGIMF